MPWAARINIRPLAREAIQRIAQNERIAVATAIGNAIDDYVTARST